MDSSNQKLQMDELGRMDETTFNSSPKIPVTVVLDNIRSGHNVGAFFRTADAFRLEQIHLCGYTPQPPNKEIRKSALGATETVAWTHKASTIESVKALKDQGYTVFAIEQTTNSQTLEGFSFAGSKIALVFGNEVRGVEQEVIDLCDGSIEIEQRGTKHSINVSVCGGIVLWECFKQLKFNLD